MSDINLTGEWAYLKPALLTMKLAEDNSPYGKYFEFSINNDFSIDTTGEEPTPVDFGRRMVQAMHISSVIQNAGDSYDAFELYRERLIEKANEMDVPDDFKDLLKSDLFYYKISGGEE